MKIGIISNTNTKGQLVIPSSIREELEITEDTPLQLVVKGKVLYIQPITAVITSAENDNNYLEMLKKTKGSWRKEKGIPSERKSLELQASEKRKSAW